MSESEMSSQVSSIDVNIESSVLYLTVKQAVIFVNKDKNNLNDPYVLIKFLHKPSNKQVQRTTTFKMNTNSPQWQERFVCHVPTMD